MIDRLKTELKQAMKNKDKKRTATIRMLISDIDKESKLKGKKRPDVMVIANYRKKLEKSLVFYGTSEVLEALKIEIEIVKEFLPIMMTRQEVIEFIKENVQDVKMQTVMPLLKGKVEGQVLKDIIDNWGK